MMDMNMVKPMPWSWLPPSPFRCPRCGTITLTREAEPTCLYREGT